MDAPKLVTPPAGAVVTLAEVKEHCRVYFDDDDTILTALMTAAVAKMDGWRGLVGRCLLEQTWQTSHWDWPRTWCGIKRDYILSPFPDILDVEVTYADGQGQEQILAATDIAIDGDRIRFYTTPTLVDQPNDRPIKINWTCGYESVPDELKLAIKMLVAHWYDNRESVTTLKLMETPESVMFLIEPFKAFR